MKKIVTISLDKDTARWVRVEAARQDVSVWRFLGVVLEERRRRAEGYEAARAAFMVREPRPLRSPGDDLPARKDLHDRSISRP